MSPWVLWFGGLLLAFAAIETWANIVGRPTLSRTIWRLDLHYPILGFVLGFFVGGLAVHFFGFIPACNP